MDGGGPAPFGFSIRVHSRPFAVEIIGFRTSVFGFLIHVYLCLLPIIGSVVEILFPQKTQ
jgi:hypothetical protein